MLGHKESVDLHFIRVYQGAKVNVGKRYDA